MFIFEALKYIKPTQAQLIGVALFLITGSLTYAVVFNMLTAGSPINVTQVDENFTAIEARISSLESRLASMTVSAEHGQTVIHSSVTNTKVPNGRANPISNGVGGTVLPDTKKQ